MIDALGEEVEDGDEVVYLAANYRDLRLGTVMYATPQGVRIMPCKGDREVNRLSAYFVRRENKDE